MVEIRGYIYMYTEKVLPKLNRAQARAMNFNEDRFVAFSFKIIEI